MKKLLFLTTLIAFSATSFAQATFGAQVGGNLASAKIEQTEGGTTIKQKTDPKFGFLIGVVAEVPFGSSINFRPELNFIQKGHKFSETTNGGTSTDKVTLNYIELPLNFVYNAPAGSGTVFFGAGPSFGFGISGKDKTTETNSPEVITDIKFDGKMNSTSNDNKIHLKGFDYGANILAGYKMASGISLNIGYTFGFANIIADNNITYKNIGGLSFKLGYMFGGADAK